MYTGDCGAKLMISVVGLKRRFKRTLLASGALRAWSRLGGPRIVILRYHSVVEDPRAFEATIGTAIIHQAETFRKQMALVARDYSVVTLDDIARYLQGGGRLPRRAVAITFDDGFQDNYQVAAGILERYGLRAAFYVTTGPVESAKPPWFCSLRWAFRRATVGRWVDSASGRAYDLGRDGERDEAFLCSCRRCATITGRDQDSYVQAVTVDLRAHALDGQARLMMNWDEIRDLHGRGHVIGAHTVSHPNIAHVPAHDARRELAESKSALERILQAQVVHFSYPSPILEPHWTPATVALTREVGYRTAVTCTPGPARPGDDPLSLRRVWVPGDLEEFRWTLEATLAGRSG